ncbi:MAG: phosphomannomutase [Candidatus Sedimenticola endophacoides]
MSGGAAMGGMTVSGLMDESGVGFGTSGVRGLVSAMSDRVCYLYTMAFLQYLLGQGVIGAGDQVAVAGDRRASTPRIAAAVIAAIRAMGLRPVYCGLIPSPAVALFGLEQSIATVMVTGSHIPDDRNGIKFNTPAGEILKPDEEAIRRQGMDPDPSLFDERGNLRSPPTLPVADGAARAAYLDRYMALFPAGLLAGLRVGVYEHSSVCRDLLGELLRGLGAEVVRLGRSGRFIPVDTEAIRTEDVALALEWTRERRLDALVSTDGDGDRPLVGDERGVWLRGDVAGILTAQYLGARTVVTPVSSNSALERSGLFGRTERTRIGSPFVIEAMQRLQAAGAERVVGYEANGGFLQQTPLEPAGRVLTPLPTRDALIVILAILAMSRQRGQPLSALVAALPGRHTHSGRVKAFPVALSRERVGAMRSGQADTDARAFARSFPGLAPVAAIDYTDGVRFRLDNDEIVHLRPSGNAPELRCYTEADSVERAHALSVFCLGVMEGWKD